MNKNDENGIKTGNVIKEFLRAYKSKPENEGNVDWLNRQFARYPDLWASPEEQMRDAKEIVETIERYDKEKAELNHYLAEGRSREKYFCSKIETATAAQGTLEVGRYAGKIDSALDCANKEMENCIFNKDGSINMNPQQKGSIMETDQASTFNIDAAVKESSARADVRHSYEKNSVDISVTKTDGSHQRYQAKCGQSAQKTEEAFQKGDYRGQQKLVPKGQTKEVPNSTDHLEADGVKSTAREHDEYKKMQDKAQKDGEITEYDWTDANKVAICKGIAKKAGYAALLAVAWQAVRIIGRRTWNWLTGKENPSAEEDCKEFISSSIQSAGGAGLTVALTGGITVAIKSGWIKILKSTPVSLIANAVCIAVETCKIFIKLCKGEISFKEAVDQAGNVGCSMTGALIGSVPGASIGAAIGSVMGPVGAWIGGVAGGAIGAFCGSTIGEALWNGAKKVVSTVGKAVKTVCNGVMNGVKALGEFVTGIFSW